MPRWAIFALVGTLFVAVLGSSHYYLYRRLRGALPLTGRRSRRIALIVLAALALSFPLANVLLHLHYCPTTCTLYWLAALWVGLFLYLFLFNLLGQLLLLALRLARRPAGPRLRRGVVLASCAAAMAVTAWGVYEARCAAGTTRIELPLAALPPELDGLTIAQISDVHVGAVINGRRLEKIVTQVNGLRPDLVVITGDLVDQDAERFQALSKPLARLRARLGVFAVTGNHEYLSNVTEAVKYAGRAGITFLRNEKRELPGGLLLYGVDDPTGRRLGFEVPELDQVVGPEARRAPAILLHHRPVGLARAAALGIDLMLSGHTHRGQMWPITYISRLIFPYQSGLYRHGETYLYVSRGIGTWGPPLRVGSPPEVALFTLRARR